MSDGTVLENAIIRLLREKPFYGHFLLNLRKSYNPVSPHPAGVTVRGGVPLLSTSPSFDSLTTLEQAALLEHLIKHLLHLHPLRRKERNRHDWDAACDMAINPFIAGLPGNSTMPDDFGLEAGFSAEEYYSLLVPPFDCGNLEGSGIGDSEREYAGGSGKGRNTLRYADSMDDHRIWDDAESTPLPLGEEMIRTITRDSLRGSDGEIPPDISALVHELMTPLPVHWRQTLRQFIATAGRTGRKSTWMREHRRFAHITPGIRKHRRINLLVGVDVSDSTNRPELREAFAAELLRLSSAADTRITVLYANSRIQQIELFQGKQGVVSRYDGGGFTDLRPVFDYAKGMHPLPAAVIYLTDGIGPAPETMEFPTLWVLTAEGEKPAPWGVELRLA